MKFSRQDFLVLHSTYTTKILTDSQELIFISSKHSENVFQVNRLIVKDLEKSYIVNEICDKKHKTENYDSQNGIDNFSADSCVNIDISSCYATVLFNNGLVERETFESLQRLKKSERLPAIGMLAKRNLVYTYKNGELTSAEPEDQKGVYSEIFYYLVERTNEIMNQLRAVDQSNYIMHWVDGIFFKPSINGDLVSMCEDILKGEGFTYKFETVENFDFRRNEDMVTVKMLKNGEPKEIRFLDRNFQKNYADIVKRSIK